MPPTVTPLMNCWRIKSIDRFPWWFARRRGGMRAAGLAPEAHSPREGGEAKRAPGRRMPARRRVPGGLLGFRVDGLVAAASLDFEGGHRAADALALVVPGEGAGQAVEGLLH